MSCNALFHNNENFNAVVFLTYIIWALLFTSYGRCSRTHSQQNVMLNVIEDDKFLGVFNLTETIYSQIHVKIKWVRDFF